MNKFNIDDICFCLINNKIEQVKIDTILIEKTKYQQTIK